MPMIRAFDGSDDMEEPKVTFFTDPDDQYNYNNSSQNSGIGLASRKKFGIGKTIVENPFSGKPVLVPGINTGIINYNNPFQKVNNNNGLSKSRFSSTTDDSKFLSSSDSTTYVSQSCISEKERKSSLYSKSSLNDEYKSPTNLTESKRLESARAQLVMRSYYKTFRIMAIITLLIFICPIMATVMEMTCVSSSTICLPMYEIQTSKNLPFEKEGYWITNIFAMRGIQSSKLTNNKENILNNGSKLIQSFSERVLNSPMKLNVIYNKLQNIFENKERVTFKIGHLGYCKKTETATFSKISCHSLFENGFDLFSVFIKDIFYELSLDEIEGNADFVSDIFVDSYKTFINDQIVTDLNFDKIIQFVNYSSILSKVMTWVSLIQFGFDFFSLILCSIVFFHLKNKTTLEAIKIIKSYVSKSLSPVDQNKNTTSKLINRLLTLANASLVISLILKLSVIMYEINYIQKIEILMNLLNFQLFEGIKLVSSGMLIDIINCSLHLMIISFLSIVIIFKPWVLKIVI